MNLLSLCRRDCEKGSESRTKFAVDKVEVDVPSTTRDFTCPPHPDVKASPAANEFCFLQVAGFEFQSQSRTDEYA